MREVVVMSFEEWQARLAMDDAIDRAFRRLARQARRRERGRPYRELAAAIRQMAEEMNGPGWGDEPGSVTACVPHTREPILGRAASRPIATGRYQETGNATRARFPNTPHASG